MTLQRYFPSGIIRSSLPVPALKAFVVMTLLCGMFTLSLVSISLRSNYVLEVGSPSDQFLIPSDQKLETMSDIQLLDVFTKYINSFQIMCRNHKRIGLLADGGKEVCVDDVIRPSSPCIAYSFGRWRDEKTYFTVEANNQRTRVEMVKNSNNQFDFEDKVITHFGCEVLTFDPTMNALDKTALKIPKGCRFYDKGLEGVNMPEKKMYTLDTLLKQFNHSERTLDLLKLDIEGSEWSALDQMMTSGSLQNVRQLLIEYHFEDLTTSEKRRNLGVFRRLYDYGFRVFSRERNIGRAKFIKEFGYSVALYVEISYVNIRFI